MARASTPTMDRNSHEIVAAEARVLACFERAIDFGMHEELAELCERSIAVLAQLRGSDAAKRRPV